MTGSGDRLNQLLAAAGLARLEPEQIEKFDVYLQLLLRWNTRINLTAVRKEEEVLSRHFLESIACAQYLPADIGTLLDFGSGAGFPGIPIALCRPTLAVTLTESQSKKAAFLAEAIRQLGLHARVFAGRAETLQERFACVTLRAVDRMEKAVALASGLVAPAGWLAAMTTIQDAPMIREAAGGPFGWLEPQRLPGSEQRVLLLGSRTLRK